MITHSSKERIVWSNKAVGLIAAATMVLGLLLCQSSAQAADTFTVESTIDTPDANVGDGHCDVSLAVVGFQCTLRAAIQEANATPEHDSIRFSILDGTSGVKTINVGAAGFGALPAITEPVTIDGYTQPGSSPNTKAVGDDAVLKIELNGSGLTSGDGLLITGVSGGSVIKGLAINRFPDGVSIAGDTVDNHIEGNFIGTNPAGTTDQGNKDDGVNITNGASENVIGGTTPAARNVISGNDVDAIFIADANGNFVQGNYVGTDKSGTKGIGNDDVTTLLNNASDNTIGGATTGAGNVISGNKSDGIGIVGGGTDNKVLGNRIGTTANGTGALANVRDGVHIQSSNNLVGDGTAAGANTIAFNGGDGVNGAEGTGNEFFRNSIFSNTGLGIDLRGDGPTANDPGDADVGPNGLQNKPVLTSAETSSTKTTIKGTLNGSREVGYLIQFYSNPSGNEGKKFIGKKEITTNTSGNASFTFSPANKVPAGQTVTATAQGSRSPSEGTSEFSAPRKVTLASGSALAPETTKVSGPSGVTRSPTAHFKFDSTDPVATFECSLGGEAFYTCSTPENIHGLPGGRHTFAVRALDEKGNFDSTPAVWIWAVDRKK